MSMTTCPATSGPAEAGAISVYEAIGGRAAVVAAVDDFYGRLLADPRLGAFFPGGVGVRHRTYVVTILGEALGGPERYRGEMVGGDPGLGISHAHFDGAAAHLGATLDELGLPRELADRIVAVVAGLRSAGRGHRRHHLRLSECAGTASSSRRHPLTTPGTLTIVSLISHM